MKARTSNRGSTSPQHRLSRQNRGCCGFCDCTLEGRPQRTSRAILKSINFFLDGSNPRAIGCVPSTYWRCDAIQTRTDYAGVLLLCVAFPRCDCQTRAKGDPTPGVTIRQRQDWSRRPMLPRGFALMVVIWLITGCAAIRPVSSPESRHQNPDAWSPALFLRKRVRLYSLALALGFRTFEALRMSEASFCTAP